MNIRLEGTHAELKAVHQLIYEADKDAIVEEVNNSTPGVHSEPIVIALITGVSSAVIAAINQYFKFQTSKLKDATEREKIKNNHEIEKIKLFVEYSKGSYKEIPPEELEKLGDK